MTKAVYLLSVQLLINLHLGIPQHYIQNPRKSTTYNLQLEMLLFPPSSLQRLLSAISQGLVCRSGRLQKAGALTNHLAATHHEL